MIPDPIPRAEELYARPECPEPGRWIAPDGIATESDVSRFIAALVTMLKPDLVVETGAYLGHTTEAIGKALELEGRGRLIALEIAGDRALSVQERVRGLPVQVAYTDSLVWMPSGLIDLLFVDSEYDARVEEVRRFRPLASPRCVVVAHDTVMIDYRHKFPPLRDGGPIEASALGLQRPCGSEVSAVERRRPH